MRTFHRVDEAEERLPVSESIAVIAGLSVLSWGVVILFAVALSTAL